MARVDAREFAEWNAFYQLEPFGEERADWRMAQLCCLVVGALGGKASKISLSDFMWQDEPERAAAKPKKSSQEMAAIFASFAEAHNAKLRQERK